MKKLISILAVLALTAPCFASSVTITASATGDTLTIGYANASGGVPVGVSMEVNLTAGDCYVNAAADVTPGADGKHQVYIDWAYTNGTSTMTPATGVSTSTSAHPLALIGSAGAATLGSSTAGADFALCMGELATTPASTGTLAIIKFTQGTLSTATVQLQADTSNRGGIVDENGDAMTVTWPGSQTLTFTATCACLGDVYPVGAPDAKITSSDVSTTVSYYGSYASGFPTKKIASTSPYYILCMDLNADDKVTSLDVSTLVSWYGSYATGFPTKKINCPHPYTP